MFNNHNHPVVHCLPSTTQKIQDSASVFYSCSVRSSFWATIYCKHTRNRSQYSLPFFQVAAGWLGSLAVALECPARRNRNNRTDERSAIMGTFTCNVSSCDPHLCRVASLRTCQAQRLHGQPSCFHLRPAGPALNFQMIPGI